MSQSINTPSPLVGSDQLPFAGAVIEAIHLNVTGRKKSHPLQDVSLYIPARSLVALSGPEGAGKTSLLETLAGLRRPDGGQVEIDGVNLYAYRKAFLPRIGYVARQDDLHDKLTLVENLTSAARLRLPKGTGKRARQDRIDAIIGVLGLEPWRGTPAGSLGSFERFLARIGVELVTMPQALLVDGPELQVDPASDRRLVGLFRSLVAQGVTVIFVTQSPAAMQSSDRLVLLDRGGYLAWYGPPEEAAAFFAGGEASPVSAGAPSGFEAIFSRNQKSPEEWAAQYRAMPAYTRYIDEPISGKRRDLMMEDRPLIHLRDAGDGPQPPAPVAYGSAFKQYFTLLFRNIRILFRDRLALFLALGLPLVLAACIFLVANPGMYSPSGGDATEINQVFAALASLTIFISMFAFVRSVNSESIAVKRERQGALRLVPYALSKFSLVIPVAFYQGLILALAYGFATQFQGGIPAAVGIFITLFLASLVGGGIGLVASALGSSMTSSVTWALVLLLPQLIFGGLLILPRPQNPVGWAISTVMPSRVAFEALVSASGYGTDVAQDICWALPASQRQALPEAQKQSCTCTGANIFLKCSFPGVRAAVTPALDQPEPVAPIPDTGINQLPVQPLLQPGESVEQYANEIGKYTLQLETYQGIVSSYLSQMQQYLDAALSWQKSQSYAIGNAESRISDQIDRYGPIYGVDLGARWLVLLATSLVFLLVFVLTQIGKGRVV